MRRGSAPRAPSVERSGTVKTGPAASSASIAAGPRRSKKRLRTCWIGRWAVWRLPAAAKAFILTADVAAAAIAIVVAVVGGGADRGQWIRLGLLVTLGVGYVQLTSRVEVLRRYLTTNQGTAVNVTAVWAIPAALTLPVSLAVTVNVALTGHALLWTARRKISHPYRVMFVGAAAGLATMTASGIAGAMGTRHAMIFSEWRLPAGLGLLAAVAAYALVNAVVMAAGVYLATRPARVFEVMLGREDWALEGVTLILGVFVADQLWRMPWVVPAVAGAVLLVQRSMLVSRLRAAAETDSKTGLLQPAIWEARARKELEHAARQHTTAAVLMIDLDYFKQINDTHGHRAGDAVLRAVADCLRAELRSYDVIGRHGGEEFAVLLPETDVAAANRIAERIRARVASAPLEGIPVTTSIGVSSYPQHGGDLPDLFDAADKSMYAAKHAGRNCVASSARFNP